MQQKLTFVDLLDFDMQNITHGVRDSRLILLEKILELGHGVGLVNDQVALQNWLSLRKHLIFNTRPNIKVSNDFVQLNGN